MASSQLRAVQTLTRNLRASSRTFTTSARRLEAPTPVTSTSETAAVLETDSKAIGQAPNRAAVWSRSQKPRATAMTGPRFEQTDFSLQPQPYSAMELVHKVPVTWTHDRIVTCSGGGGASGHPRIFINTDKPEIASCNYCGTPYANEHHRKHLEALPETSYPLK
ncbi:lactobacillus shifted protein [Trichoderma gamsii]|uniref:Lactobacillus shifted protein n=1 Tax=Trichoderma gamsii TaxID=398673 RepID=A0A0W7VXW2_9HYPO|nr:lactobacillus shifted protein [Trichoderma gamsii]PNP47675.1 hypothetical protein TGAMA5MH_01498 [Trichoderma gamsii]PON27904.1 lactobacillus shifted protein [Trichoderma gamsii]